MKIGQIWGWTDNKGKKSGWRTMGVYACGIYSIQDGLDPKEIAQMQNVKNPKDTCITKYSRALGHHPALYLVEDVP